MVNAPTVGEKMLTHQVSCEGGLNTQMGALAIAKPDNNGYAINLINFEPGRGYRRISGYQALDSTAVGLEGTNKVVGVFVFNGTVLAAKKATSNLLLRTEEFDNAAFVKLNSTASANAVAGPFGPVVADKIIDDTTNGVHSFTQGVTKAATALPYTVSVFAKAAELTYVQLEINDGSGNGCNAVFNLSTGAIATGATGVGTPFTGLSGSIQSFGSGWYRCVLNGTSNTGTTLNTVISTHNGTTNSYAGTSTGLYLYGAQLEQNATVTFYTRVSAAAPTGTFYDLFLKQATYWQRLTTDPRSISSTGKVRKTEHSFAGTPTLILLDGSNQPVKWDGTSLTTITLTNTYPQYATVFRNRIVYSGFTGAAYSHLATISEPNTDNGFTAALGAIDINTGDTVTGVRSFRDTMYIFCRGRIKAMTGTNRDTFIIDDVTTALGCEAPDSIIEVGGDLFFYGPDGVRPISATIRNGDIELSSITKHMKPSIDVIASLYDPRNIVSVVVKEKSQFRYFFSDSTINETIARGVLGGVNSGINSHEHGADTSRWEFGTLLGINPNCGDSGYISGYEYVLHGGFDGGVYRQESGNSLNGRNIQSLYQTPHMDMGDPFIRKTVQRLRVYTELTGDVKFYIKAYFDYKLTKTAQPAAKTVDVDYDASSYGSAQALYGSADTLYGGQASPLFDISLEGSGSVVSLRFVGYGTDAPFTISGFALEYSPEGRH